MKPTTTKQTGQGDCPCERDGETTHRPDCLYFEPPQKQTGHTPGLLSQIGDDIKTAIEAAHRTEADNRPIIGAHVCHALWDAQAKLVPAMHDHAALVAVAEALEGLSGWVERVIVPTYTKRNPMPENCRAALEQSRHALAKLREVQS